MSDTIIDARVDMLRKAEVLLSKAFVEPGVVSPDKQQTASLGAIAYIMLARSLGEMTR